MKLYQAALSPNCLRVRAVANELEIETDTIDVDFRDPDSVPTELPALNPNAKVPVLVDGNFVLWESRAISRYLASCRPDRQLYPASAQTRATVDQWSFWQAVHLGPPMQRVAFERVVKAKLGLGPADDRVVKKNDEEVDRFLDVLEDGLGSKDWIAGKLSVADFALASTFVYRERAGIALGARPRVAAWIARIEDRPAWQRAVEPLVSW